MWLFFFILIIVFCRVYYKLSLVKAAVTNVRKAIRKEEKIEPESVEVLLTIVAYLVIMYWALKPWFD